VNGLVPVFPREERFGFGVMGQCAALGLAIAGHVSVALAMMPIWAAKPMVSFGSPPPAIFAEIVPISQMPSLNNTDLPATDGVTSNASTDAFVENGPSLHHVGTAPSPSGDGKLSKRPLVKQDQPAKSARSKIAPDRIAQPDIRPGNKIRELKQSDIGFNDPALAPEHRTFGHNTFVTDLPSTWKSALLAHLERFKRYPETAKSRHEEGISLLSFTLDRNGRVLSFFVARGSGSDDLDGAAQAMIERASPVPAIPDDVPGRTVQLVVPVRFTVRQ
jgi:protein TonB